MLQFHYVRSPLPLKGIRVDLNYGISTCDTATAFYSVTQIYVLTKRQNYITVCTISLYFIYVF